MTMKTSHSVSPRSRKRSMESARSFPSLATASSEGGVSSMLDGGSTFTGNDDSTAVIENIRRPHELPTNQRSFGADNSIVASSNSDGSRPIETRDAIEEKSSGRTSPTKDLADPDEDVRMSRRREAIRSRLTNDANVPPKSPMKTPPRSPRSPTSISGRNPEVVKRSRSLPRKVLKSDGERLEAVMELRANRSELTPMDSSTEHLLAPSVLESSDGPRAVAGQSSGAEETDQIVREVRKRLINLACARSSSYDSNDVSDKWEPTPSDRHRGGNQWVPIDEEAETMPRSRGRGLASKSDLSESDDEEDPKECCMCSKRCIIGAVILVLMIILAIVIATQLFPRARNDKSLSLGTAITPSSPSVAPSGLPSGPPIGEKFTASPTFTVPPSMTILELMRSKLYPISGDALSNETTPQFAALDWLVNIDDTGKPVEGLPMRIVSERYILSLVYIALNGEGWHFQYGFLDGTSVCDWHDQQSALGVFCDDDGNVREIALNANNVRGELPAEIGALSALLVMEMRNNRIRGTIPDSFGQLSQLEELDLRQNRLTGTVPETIFNLPSLRKLFLFLNRNLGGSIPTSIHLASNLQFISFQRCRLSGSLPGEMASLSDLSFLTFMENQLTGSIPSGLTTLPALEVLELSGNALTGSIPEFGGQEDLYFVSMFNNQLTGSIPTSLGYLPGLLFVDLRTNMLQGAIPASVGSLPLLVTFFVSDNLLTGPIPSFAGNEGELQAISVADNMLNGNIDVFFAETGPTEKLASVNLGNNNLSGNIPSTIAAFSSLKSLLLKENQFNGNIPEEIGRLRMLDTLSLRRNLLTGTIPDSVGGLRNILYLELGENELSGTIPKELSGLSSILSLALESNQLTGKVPKTLDSLNELNKLWLHNNSLTGDLDPIFCHGKSSPQKIFDFQADCEEPDAEVTCDCCTHCCDDDSGECWPRD